MTLFVKNLIASAGLLEIQQVVPDFFLQPFPEELLFMCNRPGNPGPKVNRTRQEDAENREH